MHDGFNYRKLFANLMLKKDIFDFHGSFLFLKKIRRDGSFFLTIQRRGIAMENQNAPSPEDLIVLAREGDEKALGLLLDLYRNYLALLSRVQIGKRLQGKMDASDVVQETFLSAFKQFSAFRGQTEAELVSWLRKILAGNIANLIQFYQGTKKRDIRLEQQLAGDLDHSSRALNKVELPAGESSPSQRAIHREQEVLLADALGRLPEHYQEVILLSHLEGLSFPEVARRMNRTVDSVKNLWLRALARLRTSLGE